MRTGSGRAGARDHPFRSTPFREFRAFAVKGKRIDLVIGVAFAAIVSALADGTIMPAVGLLIGGVDFASIVTVLKEGTPAGPYATVESAQEAGAVILRWGTLITSSLTLVTVAFSIFAGVK